MDIRRYTPCLVWVNVYAFSYWVRNSINGFMKIKLNYLKSLFSQWVNEGIMWETFWDDVDVIRRVYRNPFVTSYNGNNNLMNLNNHDQSNYSFWIFIRRHQYTLESSRFSCYINWIKDQNIFNQNYIKQAYIAKFQYVCKDNVSHGQKQYPRKTFIRCIHAYFDYEYWIPSWEVQSHDLLTTWWFCQ